MTEFEGDPFAGDLATQRRELFKEKYLKMKNKPTIILLK